MRPTHNLVHFMRALTTDTCNGTRAHERDRPHVVVAIIDRIYEALPCSSSEAAATHESANGGGRSAGADSSSRSLSSAASQGLGRGRGEDASRRAGSLTGFLIPFV